MGDMAEKQVGAVLSPRLVKLLVGKADTDRIFPDDMTLDGDDFEFYVALGDLARSRDNKQLVDLLLQSFLLNGKIVCPLPEHQQGGVPFVLERGVGYLAHRGLVAGVHQPFFSDRGYMRGRSREDGVWQSDWLLEQTRCFELVAFSFVEYLRDNPQYSKWTKEVDLGKEDAIGLYAFGFLYHLAFVLFFEKRATDVMEGRASWDVSLQDFADYLRTGRKPQHKQFSWAGRFSTRIARFPFLRSAALSWLTSHDNAVPFVSANIAPFQNVRVEPLMKYLAPRKDDTAWAYVCAGDEIAPYQFSSEVETPPDIPLQRVRLTINDDSRDLGNLSLEEVIELRHEPRFVTLQHALSEIRRQLLLPLDKTIDHTLIKHALGDVRIFREKSRPSKFANAANRIITYGSIPVSVVEALTYGGSVVGLGMNVASVALQGAADTGHLHRDRWIVHL